MDELAYGSDAVVFARVQMMEKRLEGDKFAL